MSWTWGEHVGELELRMEAPSEAAVFEDALQALGELLSGEEEDAAGPPEAREVAVEAPDRAGLLAAWLGELAFLAETEGVVPEKAETLELGPERVQARVHGRRGSPPHLVKAVTYHRLAFEPVRDGFRALAVLDV